MNNIREQIKDKKRIVVKIGSSSLQHAETGDLDYTRLEKLVRELCDISNQGKEVVLVTSGAIAAGKQAVHLKTTEGQTQAESMAIKQACSAIGQARLMMTYQKLFAEYNQVAAQILMTKNTIVDNLNRYNAHNTFTQLLKMGAIPVVNENDTVAFEEIKFGDNDTLAALVGTLIDADLVILLTDIDGFYDGDPRKRKDAKRISVVETIDAQVESLAGSVGSKFGSGGMATKITAASIAVNAGIPLMIAHGAESHIIRKLTGGEDVGTLFLPIEMKPHLRKKWIAFGSHVGGRLVVDDGAKDALIHKGKSLLPSGITAVEGDFAAGDVVEIVDGQGREFARGISNYSWMELHKIKGQKSKDICPILGYKDYDEAIHRDNLSLIL